MTAIDSVERLLSENPELVDVGEPQEETLIRRAEEYLGVRFPPSYRTFLRRWGTLAVGPDEYYGIVGPAFEPSAVPDAIWFTEKKRRELDLPRNLVVVLNAEGDEYYCIDTSQRDADDECPVVTWDVPSRTLVQEKANTFDEFLLERIRSYVNE